MSDKRKHKEDNTSDIKVGEKSGDDAFGNGKEEKEKHSLKDVGEEEKEDDDSDF